MRTYEEQRLIKTVNDSNMDEADKLASVLYDGETWFVKLADIYPATTDSGDRKNV